MAARHLYQNVTSYHNVTTGDNSQQHNGDVYNHAEVTLQLFQTGRMGYNIVSEARSAAKSASRLQTLIKVEKKRYVVICIRDV